MIFALSRADSDFEVLINDFFLSFRLKRQNLSKRVRQVSNDSQPFRINQENIHKKKNAILILHNTRLFEVYLFDNVCERMNQVSYHTDFLRLPSR